MKINKIKRLYEEDLMQMLPTNAAMQPPQPIQPMNQMPAMNAPMPAQIEMPMDSGELEFAAEEPMGQQEMGGVSPEVSQMTIGDFLQKCKDVDALVCMGIEAFIEKNKDVFTGGMSSMDSQIEDELKDVEFGAKPEDNMPELEFPIEPAEMN